MRKKFLIASATLALVLTLACGGDSPTTAGGGMLAVELTDAPTEEVSVIEVYIAGLTVKPSGRSVERIATDVGPIDLLTLTGGATELLARVGVAPGGYEFITVELDQSRSHVVEVASGQRRPLQIASQQIKVPGGFEVFADTTTTLRLDFDAEASLRKRGNGSWLMVPVIVQVSSGRS
jgi:hypothetical protein